MNITINRNVSLTCFLFFISQNLLADEIISLQSRKGVTQEYLLLETENASANVILFTGGKGKLKLTDEWLARRGYNFLVRTRELFRQQGFNVAVFNAPSDKRSSTGMLFGFRTSDEHVQDISAVVENLKKRNSLPVWLIGTSRGTESVAWAAIKSNGFKGIVLTASITESTDAGTALIDMPLSEIRVPVLLATHRDDECHVSEPQGTEYIVKYLTSSPKVEVAYFSGGKDPVSKPCKARSAHGFYGIEQQVVSRISEFITTLK